MDMESASKVCEIVTDTECDMEREMRPFEPPPPFRDLLGGSPLPSPPRPWGLRPVGGGWLWRPAEALGVLRAAAAAWAAILSV